MGPSFKDDDVADVLDEIARVANRLRRMIPGLSLQQLDAVARCCPWEGRAELTLLDLDTWAVVAAVSLRGLDQMAG